MTDRSQIDPSAATNQPSSTPGPVAPSQPEQGTGIAPGAVPGPQTAQPGGAVQPVATEGTTPSPPQPDLQAELAREREARQQLQNQYRQNQQMIQQVQRYAQEQQENQQLQQQVDMMLATADNMPSGEANTYLRGQIKNLLGQTKIQSQQAIQQLQQQHQQEIRTVAAGPYADHLIQSMGLPPEAKEELMALGDPEMMYRQAPGIKQRYDRFNAQLAQYQDNQQQIARSQEVNAIRQNGLANVGGQGAGASYELEVSDDPDIRAMQVLAHLRERERQARA